MTNEERIQKIEEALSNNDIVGVRGLPETDAAKKYRKNQFITKSFAHYDEGDEPLDGTSAIIITKWDDEDEIIEKIERARNEYSDTGRVILIAGDSGEIGEDIDEIIISNEVPSGAWYAYRGARYICDL